MAVFSKYSNHVATNLSNRQNIIHKHALNLSDGYTTQSADFGVLLTIKFKQNTGRDFCWDQYPRFYYNFSPEVPVQNYAQILINTETEETTDELAEELSHVVDNLVPEGVVQVKLMQQGQPLKAPVEVRIIVEDINRLKQIAAQVAEVVKKAKGNRLVRNDFREDYYGVAIQLKNDASRLRFTTTGIRPSNYKFPFAPERNDLVRAPLRGMYMCFFSSPFLFKTSSLGAWRFFLRDLGSVIPLYL
ncbi:hypothetical protein [Dyadobacter sp. 32]|uniref:hypothetical protein n=1 Tax=Dyadobacter sp. 32 TaxID=538966 RepID=UPI0011ED292B